jgi:hypothetical protein
MRTTGLDDVIGHENIYDSVHAGVDAFLAEPEAKPAPPPASVEKI